MPVDFWRTSTSRVEPLTHAQCEGATGGTRFRWQLRSDGFGLGHRPSADHSCRHSLVLWTMDRVDGADRLIEEMGVTPSDPLWELLRQVLCGWARFRLVGEHALRIVGSWLHYHCRWRPPGWLPLRVPFRCSLGRRWLTRPLCIRKKGRATPNRLGPVRAGVKILGRLPKKRRCFGR